MALSVFTPPVGPTYPTERQTTPRLKTAQFGDGYRQSAPDGLNHLDREVSPSWDNLTLAEKTAIEDFFDARGGSEPFSYTLHGVTDTYLCTAWSSAKTSPNAYSVSAKFERSFLL